MATDTDASAEDSRVADQTASYDSGIADPIIEMRNARVTYDDGETYVLNNVSLDIERHEIIGVIGESGSGKSMLASALLDANPDPGYLTGSIKYRPSRGEEIEILNLDKQELKRLRWEDISMVFQGAMSSFNPTMKIGDHFEETLKAHNADIEAGMDRARELLADLYLQPDRVLNGYPHELSGGMQQRALIALSLVLEPELLVMDEPTAALDLLMQRSILRLLQELQEKYELTMLFITHDLPLVASLADRMGIMYAFQLIEVGETHDLVENAAHPYTRALLNATPNLDAPLEDMRPIEGSQPAPINVPSGCSYHPRCPLADQQCRASEPEYHAVSDTHNAACYHWEEAREQIPLNYDENLGSAASSGGED